MRQRLYVRVAKRPHGSLVQGSRFKIDAGPSHNPRPLEQGAYLLKTLHFAIDVDLPDRLFDDMALPVVRLEIKPGESYVVEPTIEPTIVQVELAEPPSEHADA
jgi:hypothetical protein